MSGINWLDLAVLGLLLLSGLLALARGFVAEVLSIVGWVGAAIATLKLFDLVQPIARLHITPALVADVVAGAAIFFATLILLSLLAGAIGRRVRDSELSMLDRSLGFVFGLARGAVLIGLAYLVFAQLAPPKQHPDWIKDAKSLPAIRYAALALASLAPESVAKALETVDEAGQAAGAAIGAGKAVRDAKEAADKLGAPPDRAKESGYKSEDRQQIDRLIGTTQER
ncbi:MAG: CvpA family protein [Alphaproteobacteria bacterium]|nr:CvpA family protein [Alphaproteobacteria bacterium]